MSLLRLLLFYGDRFFIQIVSACGATYMHGINRFSCCCNEICNVFAHQKSAPKWSALRQLVFFDIIDDVGSWVILTNDVHNVDAYGDFPN